MLTLEELFRPAFNGGTHANATLFIDDNKLVIDVCCDGAAVGTVTLPLGLSAEIKLKGSLDAKPVPVKPVAIDLMDAMANYNAMNTDMLRNGVLPTPLSDFRYHCELYEDGEDLDGQRAAEKAAALAEFMPLWVMANKVPTMEITSFQLRINAYGERHTFPYADYGDAEMAGVLKGIIALYHNIVVI